MAEAMITQGQKWRNLTMDKMKVFHLNDNDWKIPDKIGERHDSKTSKYWGHIVTNTATRTDSRFAYLFDPNGERCNLITRATFSRLTEKCEHIYEPVVSEKELNEFIEKISALSKFQTHRLFKSLIKQNSYLENYQTFDHAKKSGTVYPVFLED